VALFAAGCTSDEHAHTSGSPEAVAPTLSIAPPATTTSIVSAPAPNTAPPPDPTPADVLGSFEFGADPDTVISMANGSIGIPVFDTTEGFDRRVGHIVCWADLCMQFGNSHSREVFVGWKYRIVPP
jgi:hypothetical protein